jgi:hypothetical protein
LFSFLYMQVTGALAASTDYDEPDPGIPPPSATLRDMADALWHDCCPLCVQVTGALAASTDYEEPDPGMPPANATAEDMAELEAKACAATSLSVAGFKLQGIKGTVKGYGSITLPVEFTPRVAGVCWSLSY